MLVVLLGPVGRATHGRLPPRYTIVQLAGSFALSCCCPCAPGHAKSRKLTRTSRMFALGLVPVSEMGYDSRADRKEIIEIR